MATPKTKAEQMADAERLLIHALVASELETRDQYTALLLLSARWASLIGIPHDKCEELFKAFRELNDHSPYNNGLRAQMAKAGA